MKNKKTQYEVKVGRYWVVVSDIGYSHYKGKKRICERNPQPRQDSVCIALCTTDECMNL